MQHLLETLHSGGDIGRAALLIGVSALLVLLVLLLLGALYRSNDEKVAGVTIVNDAVDGTIIFAQTHLPRGVHEGRYAYIEFRRSPDEKRPLLKPAPRLKIRLYERNTQYVNASQICVENGTFEQLAAVFPESVTQEKYQILTQKLSVRIRYPSMFNIGYLLNLHPDISVRATAWIFVLTSGFSVAQTLLMWALGY